jgi:hypothetical protein
MPDGMGSGAATRDGEVKGAVAATLRFGTLKKKSWVVVWIKSFGKGRTRSVSMLNFPWLVPGELPEYVDTGDPARGP